MKIDRRIASTNGTVTTRTRQIGAGALRTARYSTEQTLGLLLVVNCGVVELFAFDSRPAHG
jgi:hypothetical protein